MTSLQYSPSFSRKRWWSLTVVALAVFMATVDAGLLSIALPVIITDFQADLSLAGWLAVIYALVTASLYLPCGRLADLTGRKKIFTAGFLLYGTSSVVAGLSQNGSQLIALRGLQAVGSAVMMANTFALTTSLFPPEERGRALGIAGGTVSALGYTLGPVLGGLLTHALGWRAIFYVTAGFGFIGFAAARLLLPDDSQTKTGGSILARFDITGALSFAISISAFLLALTAGQKASWSSTIIVLELCAGCFALAFFIWWESRVASPLLDLRLFMIRAFVAGNVARLICFVTISVNSLMMPFFLQLAMGLDPLHAGMLIAPTPLALAILSPLSGWLSERLTARLLCAAGLIVMGIGFGYLAFLQLGSSSFDIVFRLALVGIGLGIFQTPNNNSLMSSIPRERLGVGSSFLSIIRSLGNSAGAALSTAIVSAQLLAGTGQTSLNELRGAAGIESSSPTVSAFLQGFRYTFLTAAMLSFAGALISSLAREENR
jgi:EmrB/QacA subfamily drug resistance transporter